MKEGLYPGASIPPENGGFKRGQWSKELGYQLMPTTTYQTPIAA